MRSIVANFILALSFLTRLVPARVVPSERLGHSLPYFPLAGLAIGLVLVVPWSLGLAAGHPWIQAWLWLAGALFVTRGLHWDGWADLWDAWGSGTRDERFWDALKDSRLGAFGGMGLFMGLACHLVLLHYIFELQAWSLLVWIPALGRSAAPVLAWMGRDLQRPGLAAAFLAAADARCLVLVILQTLLLGLLFVSGKTLLVALVLMLAGVMILARLAKSRGGLNGDFLGAAIIWGETSAMLGWLT